MDQNTNFSQNVDSLFSNLEEFTRNESLLGKPTTHEGKTLIPVISVTVGYGSGNTPGKNQHGSSSAASGMMQGMGALGLGAKVCTDAIILIENNNVSTLPIAGKNAAGMMDKLPQMLSSLGMGGQQQNQGQGQNNQAQQQGQQQNQ